MIQSSNFKTTVSSVWFGLLLMYILAGYLGQNALLPASTNTITLYCFFAYSVFAIFCFGKIKFTSMIYWEVSFLIASFFAMLYSPSLSVFGGMYYSLLVNFVLVFIFVQMPWNEKRFETVMMCYMFATVMLMLVLAITGNLKDMSDSGRLGEDLFGNANIFAIMLMVSAIYTMWLLVASEKRALRLIFLVALVLIYYGMFLSGGRKYIVAPLIFLYILMLHKKDRQGKTRFIKATLLIVAIALTLYFLIMKTSVFYESIGYRFESFFNLFADEKEADGSALSRKAMMQAAFEGWTRAPLFGHGFDSFKYFNRESVTGDFHYSHNNYAELLYNQGIFGFLIYYSFYIYLLIKAWKMDGDSLKKGFVVAVVLTLLFSDFFSNSYNATPIQFMLFFCYYITTKEHQNNRKETLIDGEIKNNDEPFNS